MSNSQENKNSEEKNWSQMVEEWDEEWEQEQKQEELIAKADKARRSAFERRLREGSEWLSKYSKKENTEEKEEKIPFVNQQVWVYTDTNSKRRLATVVDPKMIDSRILYIITIPPNALFTVRLNKENPSEERRLREWPDDSKYSPNEYISILNHEDWQWYFTEPK